MSVTPYFNQISISNSLEQDTYPKYYYNPNHEFEFTNLYHQIVPLNKWATPSLLVYKTVKFVVEKAWEPYCDFFSTDFPSPAESMPFEKYLVTSCVNTVSALEKLFGLQLIKELGFYFKPKIVIPLDNLGSNYELNITALLDEPQWKNDGNLDWCNSSNQGELKNNFFNFIRPQINSIRMLNISCDAKTEQINDLFKNINYNFNQSKLNIFRETILNNIKFVSQHNSFIYGIGILCSRPEMDGCMFEHVYIIEQFLSKEGGIRYRLYQSWLTLATLKEDFSKRQYGENEEGSWDTAEMLKHIDKLILLSQKGNNVTFEDCFGYVDFSPAHTFDNSEPHIGHLKGLTFRFTANPFNPQSIIGRLAQLLNSNEDLRKYF